MCENIGSLKKCRGEHNRGKPDFARGNSLEEKKRSLRVRKGRLVGSHQKQIADRNQLEKPSRPPTIIDL